MNMQRRAFLRSLAGSLLAPAFAEARDAGDHIFQLSVFGAKQLRAEKAEDGQHYVNGYAALFNSVSEELWPGVRETLLPDAFSDVLEDDCRLTFNHNPDWLLGRTKSKTLELTQDELGLRVKNLMPETQMARDIGVLMDRGDLDQMSFMFSVRPQDIDREETGENEFLEKIKKVKRLYDVSVVTYPAYPDTIAVYRQMGQLLMSSDEKATREQLIRTVSTVRGFSAAEGSLPRAGKQQQEAEDPRIRASSYAVEQALLDLSAKNFI